MVVLPVHYKLLEFPLHWDRHDGLVVKCIEDYEEDHQEGLAREIWNNRQGTWMEYRERQTTMSLAKVSPRDVCTVKFIQSVLSFVCGRIVILYLNSPRLTWSQNQREREIRWLDCILEESSKAILSNGDFFWVEWNDWLGCLSFCSFESDLWRRRLIGWDMYDQDVNDDDDRSESIEIPLAGQKDQHVLYNNNNTRNDDNNH